jgi:hypothetical protein
MYRNLDNLGVDFYVIYRGIFLLFLLQISVHVFSLLDYICIADGDLITKKWRIGIKLTSLIPEHVCAYPKPGPGFQSTYVIVCFWVFNDLKREMVVRFVNIGGIDDHHCKKIISFPILGGSAPGAPPLDPPLI